MIVQNRQRVTPTAPRHWEMSLEVHLPQIVRLRMLEANHRLGTLRGLLVDPVVTPQNLGDRAGGRYLLATPKQHPTPNLPPSPGPVGGTHLHNPFFHLHRRLSRLRLRFPRPIRQATTPLLLVTLPPLVARLPRNPEPSAQLRHLRTLVRR